MMARSVFALVAGCGREGTTILFSGLQVAILLMVAGYLLYRRAALQRRLRTPWRTIVKKLGISAEETNASVAELDKQFSNEVIEESAGTVEGRRRMFHEAGLMLEMADYAERNGSATVAPVVASLRAHAFAIRVEAALSAAGLRAKRVRGS
jgi:hypothetical protein